MRDARVEEPFAGMAATAELGIGSYIGVPVRLSSGEVYGTLCAIDPDPREFGREPELATLLARLVAYEIDRDQLEATLHESERKYRNIFEQVLDVYYRTDARGAILEISPSIERYSGYRRVDLIGRQVEDLFVDPSERACLVSQVVRTGEIIDLEVQLRHRDGKTVYTSVNSHVVADEAGHIVGFEGTLRDVMPRRLAEQELERQYREADAARAECRAVIDATSEAMALIAPDRRFLTVNQRFGEVFGIDPAEVRGRSFDERRDRLLRALADPNAFATRLIGASRDEQEHFGAEVEQVWPEHRQLAFYSTPVRTADDVFLGRLYVFRDVTREREVDRMKTDFISHVSHELRTPLTSIKGFVDLLVADEAGELTAEQGEFLEIVSSNVNRLVALVNDLLDVSRIESGEIELERTAVDVTTIVESVVRAMRPQFADKGQSIAIDLPASLPPVWGDPTRVAQIISNLLSNAHKYTPAGGRIAMLAAAWSGYIQIDVADSGIGLSPDEQERVFARFFRARNRTTEEVGGTGLGLPITQSLVEMHGGTVWVNSTPGEGSTFSITLPIADDACRASVPFDSGVPSARP